jgi:hypothetical protein
MTLPAVTTSAPAPTQAPTVTIRGDRLPLSPEANRAAARLLLAVTRQRRKRQEQQQVDQAGAGDQAGDNQITPPRYASGDGGRQ